MDFNLVAGSHLLRALGFNPGGLMGQLEGFQEKPGVLNNLRDSFSMAAGFMAGSALASMLQQGGIPGAGCVSPPNQGACQCGNSYAQPQTFDLGASPSGLPFGPGAMMARMQGATFERFLQQNPFARAQAEMMLGGRILPDGIQDGRLQVVPFQQGQNPAAQALEQMNRGAMSMGFAPGAQMAQMFPMMMMGALANMINGSPMFGNPGGNASGLRQPGGTSPFVDWAENNGQGRRGNPMMAAGGGGSPMFGNPGVQGGGGGKGGGKGGGGGGGGAPSIDVETMKLKRLIDKRGQMFDMLRQIIDKYNETAKNIIQSIGR